MVRSATFTIAGTEVIGRKFVWSEGLPGLKIARTVECLAETRISGPVIQALIMRRMAPPTAENPTFSTQTTLQDTTLTSKLFLSQYQTTTVCTFMSQL